MIYVMYNRFINQNLFYSVMSVSHTKIYPNGDVYCGNLCNDVREGYGKMTYAFGEVYEGHWHNNEYEGNGKLMYENGDFYDGNWKNGMRDGYGSSLNGNELICGNWHEDAIVSVESVARTHFSTTGNTSNSFYTSTSTVQSNTPNQVFNGFLQLNPINQIFSDLWQQNSINQVFSNLWHLNIPVQPQPNTIVQRQPNIPVQSETTDQSNTEIPPDTPDAKECIVCYENFTEKYAIVPCGHTTLCKKCYGRLTARKCPICGTPMEFLMRCF